MMPAMNMLAMPQGQMMPGMPMMMPNMMGMMPMMMPNMMMPNMMGMMPMMMPGTMPLFCRVTMEMGKDGMTCKMMPIDAAGMEALRERWDAMMKMAATGMPMMMMCGGHMLFCTK